MENQPKTLKTHKNRHGTMKNQSGTIKTNLELYRVVKGGSGGYRRLPGGSAHFSLQTHKHFIIIYINNININFKINVNVNVNIFISSVRVPKLSSFICGKFDLA